MVFNFQLWKKQDKKLSQDENTAENSCICGSAKAYSECHEIEFELPLGERPDPD